MTILSVTEARKNLYNLIDTTHNLHEPIFIKGKRHSAVLISEDDWSALQETLYLMSVPGMTESLKQGLETPLSECVDKLDW